MSVRRNPSDSLAEEFNRVYDRIRKLEEATSKRILPAGYRWTVGDNGELVVIRESDDVEATIIT